jgi:hypothetical protein
LEETSNILRTKAQATIAISRLVGAGKLQVLYIESESERVRERREEKRKEESNRRMVGFHRISPKHERAEGNGKGSRRRRIGKERNGGRDR